MADTTKKVNTVARTLLIAGGIVLFIVLVVFIIRLVPIMFSGVANLGSALNFSSKSDEQIIIQASKEILTTQEPVIISFEYTPETAGQYFVSYSCVNGLFFDIQSSNGPQRIICDTPFRLGSNLNAISLIPIFTQPNNFIDVTITIEYKDERNTQIAKGTKILTVNSGTSTEYSDTETANQFGINNTLAASTVTATALTEAPTYAPSPVTPVAHVPTTPTRDFAITQIFPIPNQSAFTFHVYNYGNTSTGPWVFTYTNAENPSQTLLSPVQASLAPRQGMAVTVRFDYQTNSSQVISVVVNPYNQIIETNYANNTAVVTITGSTHSSPYNQNIRADLTITSMESGRMSGSRFIPTSSINERDRGAIRFTVLNQGGQETGTWRFEVYDLPYSSSNRTYTSSRQSSLRPGEYIEILVEFDGMQTGRFYPEVFVDPRNEVREEREDNNRRSVRLDVQG